MLVACRLAGLSALEAHYAVDAQHGAAGIGLLEGDQPPYRGLPSSGDRPRAARSHRRLWRGIGHMTGVVDGYGRHAADFQMTYGLSPV
jgi:hypothetical protein